MLATIPEFREVNFSHLSSELADLELGESALHYSARQKSVGLWFALFLSLLLHSLLLLFKFEAAQPYSKPPPAQTLHINLLQVSSKKPALVDVVTQEVVEQHAVPVTVQKIITAPIAVKKRVVVTTSQETNPVTHLVIEPLSLQELNDIAVHHNAQVERRASAAIGDNVFHPGLRARLATEANKPTRARAEDSILKNHLDPAGATVVKLADGNCLRSPAVLKAGTPRDWYMTSCSGKSESEMMMEGVNRNTKGRLNFEE